MGGVTFSPQAALEGEGQIPPWAQSHPGQVWADFFNSVPSRAGKRFSRVIRSISGPKSPVFLVGAAHSGCWQELGHAAEQDSHGGHGGRLRLPLSLSLMSHPAPPCFRTRGHCLCHRPKEEGLAVPSLRRPLRVPASSLQDMSRASQATDPILQRCSKASNSWMHLQREVCFLTLTSPPSQRWDCLALSLRGFWFLSE